MVGEQKDAAENLRRLAREACDLWQDHLASYASGKDGNEALMGATEALQRMFAEWTSVMQHGPYAEFFGQKPQNSHGSGSSSSGAGSERTEKTPRPPSVPLTSDGKSIDVDGLSRRVAELEEKLAALEGRARKPL